MPGKSVLLPDLLFVKFGDEWLYFQPIFFSPNNINFADGKAVECFISIDVISPRGQRGVRLYVRIDPTRLRQHFNDGAQMYECEVQGPNDLHTFASGRARSGDGADFLLELQHFTSDAARESILHDRVLRGSAWTIQGTRTFENVCHAYFTTLPAIESDEDLRQIAMSSDGEIYFAATGFGEGRVLRLPVYRGSTADRTSRLSLWVPSSALAAPSLLFHHPVGGSAYYEVVGPEIMRVALPPRDGLPFDDHLVVPSRLKLKQFQYVIVGDGSRLPGIAAPFIEDERDAVAHIEHLPIGDDVFTFWIRNANTDQFSGRRPELRKLALAPLAK